MPEIAFSAHARSNLKERLSEETFDVLIIGGGITGAAAARDASLRGLKVALIEKDDFASGTSSGSSKLIHGGIRYLQNFEFKLVREAVKERELLKQLYAPFVRDIPFVFPTFKGVYPPRWQLNLGLHLYDAFSGFQVRHQNLSKEQTLKAHQHLKPDPLTGACLYTDSFAEDYRLVIELLKSAHQHDACCVSRLSAIKFETRSNDVCTQVKDERTNEVLQIKSKTVINCAGPFTDRVREKLQLSEKMTLTQGVHFLVPRERLPIDAAYVLPDNELDRIVFVIPWRDTTFIGTTDTSIQEVEDARASKADLDYLLKVVNHYMNFELSADDIIQSWAAVRPLIKPSKQEASNSKISREHEILEEPERIFHILGGKITSHRLMAEEALDRLHPYLKLSSSRTDKVPLQEKSWPETKKPDRLEKVYGQFAPQVVACGDERLVPDLPYTSGEVLYAIREEMALSVMDFLRRRSSLYYEHPTREIFEAALALFKKELQWETQEVERERKEFHKWKEWDSEPWKKTA